MGEDEKACPSCAETIKAASIVCRHCGRDMQGRMRRTSPGSIPAAANPKNRQWLAVAAVMILVSAGTLLYERHKLQTARVAQKNAADTEETRKIRAVMEANERRRLGLPPDQPAPARPDPRPAVDPKADAAYQELLRKVEVDALRAQLRPSDDLMARWIDATKLALASSRISAAGPIASLQGIRREAIGLNVPACLSQGKVAMLDAMSGTIDALLASMRGDAPGAEAMFEQANAQLERYAKARKACVA